jgi:tetratricopeptide (TPR) repeat protein
MRFNIHGVALGHAVAGLVLFMIANSVFSKPYIPASDREILERLPYKSSDAGQREIRKLSQALRETPDNAELAADLARRHIEQGRATSDPRFFGYARAALSYWWDAPDAPTEILVLRATLYQNQHRFDQALIDLNRALQRAPDNGQARLTKAVVLQVRGEFDAALKECRMLSRLAEPIVVATCIAAVQSLNGELKSSYERLSKMSAQLERQAPALRAWVLSYLADMATRLGDWKTAESHYRAALAADPSDAFLLAAYADLLLDLKRPNEVIALLKDQERADGLLLRLALALRAAGNDKWRDSRDVLSARFAAAKLRNDRVHLREEARFTLHLLDQPQAALTLAQENWTIQKEPADARLVLDAARRAKIPNAAAHVREWLAKTRLEAVDLQGA